MCWQFGQYVMDVMDKVYIQYMVCFVQYEDFNFIKIDGVLMFKIQQMVWGGDEDVDVVVQFYYLWVDVYVVKDYQ